MKDKTAADVIAELRRLCEAVKADEAKGYIASVAIDRGRYAACRHFPALLAIAEAVVALYAAVLEFDEEGLAQHATQMQAMSKALAGLMEETKYG